MYVRNDLTINECVFEVKNYMYLYKICLLFLNSLYMLYFISLKLTSYATTSCIEYFTGAVHVLTVCMLLFVVSCTVSGELVAIGDELQHRAQLSLLITETTSNFLTNLISHTLPPQLYVQQRPESVPFVQ